VNKRAKSSQEFHTSLRRGEVAPVYFFVGEEDFLIEEALKALRSEVLRDGMKEFNLDVLYGNEADGREVVLRANSFPMMAERRMVVVRDFERLSGKEALYSYLENPSLSTVLVLISGKEDRFVEGSATVVKFPRITGPELATWISERTKGYGKKITPEAVEVLLEYVDHSLRALDRELEKVSLFVADRDEINEEDVESVVGVSKSYTLFELTKAVGSRDPRRSLEICERMLEFGEWPARMVAAINNHFMRLLKLKGGLERKMSEGELCRLLRVSSTRLQEYRGQSRQYSRAELERSFSKLVAADEKLKFTGEDPHTIMIMLLHELLRQ